MRKAYDLDIWSHDRMILIDKVRYMLRRIYRYVTSDNELRYIWSFLLFSRRRQYKITKP